MERVALGAGAFADFEVNWLARAAADALFETLRERVEWTQGSLPWFGKTIVEPRLSAWFGEADYSYSGRTVRARPLPSFLLELRTAVERAANHRFNSVFLNFYRDGRDSMGFHSDDEPELGENPVIASVSLGATRRFKLEPKRKRAVESRAFELSHGSLLIMSGTCQHTFRHGVPKSAGVSAARINLTFRWTQKSRADALPTDE